MIQSFILTGNSLKNKKDLPILEYNLVFNLSVKISKWY